MKHLLVFLLICLFLSNENAFGQENENPDIIEKINEQLDSKDAHAFEGYYGIDASKKNLHIFKKFNLALVQEEERLIIYFIDSECYGYRKYWKTGDIYASSDIGFDLKDTIPIKLFEAWGGQKHPTDYKLLIEENSIKIITKSGRSIDHFKKIGRTELLDDFALSKITYRKPSQEERQQLEFEYQAGLELMFWLSNLKAKDLTHEIILNSVEKAMDSLILHQEFPIAEYNSVWHANFGLAIVFANELISELDWDWYMIENGHSNAEVGWTVMSEDQKYAVNVEQVFYGSIMSNKNIEIGSFYNRITSEVKRNSVDPGNILFFDIPCN